MVFAHRLLEELRLEAAVTRKFLAVVPFDQSAFQPAPTSETLGRLAIHVAEIMGWWKAVLTQEELDFIDFAPADITSVAQLLSYFDGLLAEAMQALATATAEDLELTWSMRYGEIVYFTLPKSQVLRIFCMNHLVHHRAQLGVYLRILGVPLPATYGPSADDEDVILVAPFAIH
jgi:uncharacterized damage-inducible protein DinB